MIDAVFDRPQGLFDQIDSLHRALSRSLAADGVPDGIRAGNAGRFPPINVGRTPTTVEVYAFAPGLDAATIELTVERGILKLSGERPGKERGAAVQVYAAERPQG